MIKKNFKWLHIKLNFYSNVCYAVDFIKNVFFDYDFSLLYNVHERGSEKNSQKYHQ